MSSEEPLRIEVTLRLERPLDVSFRPAKEVDEMSARIASLEREIGRMRLYADFSLRLTDELRAAKARLEELGEDTSFIHLR